MMFDIIGYVAGILMSSTMLPQIIKSLKTKSVKDISLWMLIILIIGSFLWMIYGILINSLPIIIMDIVAVFINSAQLLIKIKYEKRSNRK